MYDLCTFVGSVFPAGQQQGEGRLCPSGGGTGAGKLMINHLKWKVSTLVLENKISPGIDSMQRKLGCIYCYALMGWVRELPQNCFYF